MQRVKSFDATGIAPNGYLYAGDLNAIEDAAAAEADLTQNLQVGTITIGQSGLMIIRYGAGEARVAGAMRTDGILRGLGGLYPGQFTSTQRDAIAAGSRPFGLIIFNITTNRFEYNAGTDASPNWQPVGPIAVEVPIGAVSDWPWAAGSVPANFAPPYGQAISRTAYSALNALANAAAYPYGNGDGSTTFNLPDYRGRVGVGKDDMGGTAAGRITVAISGVAGTQLGAVFGAEGITLTTAQLPAHNHVVTDPGHQHSPFTAGYSFREATYGVGSAGDVGSGNALTAWSSSNKTAVAATGITIANTGGGQVVENAQPSIIVNKMMRII